MESPFLVWVQFGSKLKRKIGFIRQDGGCDRLFFFENIDVLDGLDVLDCHLHYR